MSNLAAKTLPAAPPAEDAAIARSLGELESKLNAWIEAAESIQANWVAVAPTAEPAAAAVAASKPEPAARIDAPPESKSTAAPVAPKPAETPTAGTKSAEPERKAGMFAAKSGDAAERPAKAAANESIQPAAAEPTRSAEAPSAVDPDAALLAELDPETAKRVRMLRRLSGGTRSVRELIDEARANQSAPKEQKKSWWRS